MQRRRFLQTLAAGTLGAPASRAQQAATPQVAPSNSGAASAIPRLTEPGELRGEMLYRKFGKTGEPVSAIGLGGSHIGKPTITQQQATKLIHESIDRGITFMDNCWDYNEGRSER